MTPGRAYSDIKQNLGCLDLAFVKALLSRTVKESAPRREHTFIRNIIESIAALYSAR